MTNKKLTIYETIMEELKTIPPERQKDFLLEKITLIQPQVMLQDLLDSAVRSPALYNAVTALLKYHKIEINPLAGAQASHPVGALAHGLPPADFLDGHEFGIQ